jgi:beta-glucosidase
LFFSSYDARFRLTFAQAFESFSEDPHLSGHLATAYVQGLQSNGVGATIKHFVCNDQEDKRFAVDVQVEPRALREIYLMPFMLAQKYAKPWAFMTSYSRINGTHCESLV